ncbi:MAG: hypothetical protein L0216_20760 [Planctomycetales bacterium]|nr:hypothetical protein [Planctomycetales bacterium]
MTPRDVLAARAIRRAGADPLVWTLLLASFAVPGIALVAAWAAAPPLLDPVSVREGAAPGSRAAGTALGIAHAAVAAIAAALAASFAPAAERARGLTDVWRLAGARPRDHGGADKRAAWAVTGLFVVAPLPLYALAVAVGGAPWGPAAGAFGLAALSAGAGTALALAASARARGLRAAVLRGVVPPALFLAGTLPPGGVPFPRGVGLGTEVLATLALLVFLAPAVFRARGGRVEQGLLAAGLLMLGTAASAASLAVGGAAGRTSPLAAIADLLSANPSWWAAAPVPFLLGALLAGDVVHADSASRALEAPREEPSAELLDGLLEEAPVPGEPDAAAG